MVQRYELELYHCNGGEMEPCDEGCYVEYEDYAELEGAVTELLADINRRYPGEGFKCPLILKLAEIVEYEPRN